MPPTRQSTADPASLTLQKNDLEKAIAELVVEYEVIADQSRTTLDPGSKTRLEIRKKQLLGQIQEKEQLLGALEQQKQDINRHILSFDEALPKIDFREARRIIHRVVDDLQINEGGAALFLLQQSRRMAGDLLLLALSDVLSSGRATPIYYEVAFSPATGGADQATFLKSMGRYLGVELTDNPNVDVSVIRTTLCDALREHSTVVIQLTNWDAVGRQNQHELMQWLLETFWQPLVDELEYVLEEWNARVIFVIVANRPLTEDCQKLPCFCTVDAFDSRSILEIPLTHWTEKDIRIWLASHFRLSKPQAKTWAKQIYDESDGDPNLIRQALQDYFEQLLASQT
ncbi:hypothetical protein ACQ4N7_19055 [Nodosilinea sp. AN01ver1]|uniref:hypothetical protein n=1 Tax=Nodosilinea sp. AN01ver1 TaxID=3423362 RepID=UPI003D311BDC